MTVDFEGSIEYLESKQEGTEMSIIDHVGEVLVRLADNCPERPLDFFEPVSYILKEERMTKDDKYASLRQQYGPDFTKMVKNSSIVSMQLFPKQKLTEEEEEEEQNEPKEDEEGGGQEEEAVNEGEVPNVIDDMRFMNEVGVGLNEVETILVQNSIQKLIRSKPLATARFWGKVFGIEKDYYIAEAEFNDGERPHPEPAEEGEDEPKKEEEDQDDGEEKPRIVPPEEDAGPNLYNYFVCTTLGGQWTLLPDLTPAQIVQSRCIRQMFSGKQNGQIRAPEGRFEGDEHTLLRTFIARVSHSCTIAPVGLYQLEEEPEEGVQIENTTPITQVEPEEGVELYKPIQGLESFVHRVPCILEQGRCEFHIFEEDLTDENGEEKEPEVEHGAPILRPLSQDEPVEGVQSWSIRKVVGLHTRYWLRSNAWPGLNVVSSDNGDRLVTMYFGNGMKAEKPDEWPPLPEKKPPPPPPPPVEEEEEKHGEEEDKTNSDDDEDATPTDDNQTPTDENQTATDDNQTTQDESQGTESGTYDSTYDGGSSAA